MRGLWLSWAASAVAICRASCVCFSLFSRCVCSLAFPVCSVEASLGGFFCLFFLENKVLLPAMCIFLCISTDKLCDLNSSV